MTAFAEHDVVVALVAVPAQHDDEQDIRPGQIGAIVHIATQPDLAYLVEFVDEQGQTLAMPFMRAHQIAPWPQPSAQRATTGQASALSEFKPL